jgi:hypothetical protein
VAAFTPAEKVSFRLYLGYSSLFHQFEPRLENAIRAIQSQADGGALPDSSTADKARSILTELAAVDAQLVDTQTYSEAYAVDEIKVDYIRKGYYLRAEGRRLIGHLAIILGCKPFRDYYSGAQLRGPGEGPFFTDLG